MTKITYEISIDTYSGDAQVRRIERDRVAVWNLRNARVEISKDTTTELSPPDAEGFRWEQHKLTGNVGLSLRGTLEPTP